MIRFAILYPHESSAYRPDHNPDAPPLYLQQKGRYYGGNDRRNRTQRWTHNVEDALTWATREAAERNVPTIINGRGESYPASVVEVPDA